MNPLFVEGHSSPDDRWIDRLVDGELNARERAELLTRLEAEPDGWRRCALAFLEAREWKLALGELAAPVEKPRSSTQPIRRSWISTSVVRSAVAAGLLASTFAVGWSLGKARPANGEGGRSTALIPETSSSSPKGSPSASVRTVGTLGFGARDEHDRAEYQVPVYAGEGIDAEWINDRLPSLSEYDRGRLERRGYLVKERRRLVSANLKDGRRLAVPVDQVDLQYVGRQPL